jgi:hypothetical protein
VRARAPAGLAGLAHAAWPPLADHRLHRQVVSTPTAGPPPPAPQRALTTEAAGGALDGAAAVLARPERMAKALAFMDAAWGDEGKASAPRRHFPGARGGG